MNYMKNSNSAKWIKKPGKNRQSIENQSQKRMIKMCIRMCSEYLIDQI